VHRSFFRRRNFAAEGESGRAGEDSSVTEDKGVPPSSSSREIPASQGFGSGKNLAPDLGEKIQ
jgi:hypothetical protein